MQARAGEGLSTEGEEPRGQSTARADPGLPRHHLPPGAVATGDGAPLRKEQDGWCQEPAQGLVCPPRGLRAAVGSGRAQPGTGMGHISHPIRFPGQVAVPDDGNTLDNSQPGDRGDRGDRVCSCWPRGQGLGARATTLPVLQRHEVEVGDLHGGPDLGREGEEW